MKCKIILFILLIGCSPEAWSQSGKQGTERSSADESGKAVPAGHHHVIMQITSGDTLAHKALMHQLRNLKEYWADAVSLEVMVQGPALDMVLNSKSTQSENIARLKASGVRFVACGFSMKQRNVSEKDLLPGLESVPFGLVEIVTRQEQGWTYLKAGF